MTRHLVDNASSPMLHNITMHFQLTADKRQQEEDGVLIVEMEVAKILLVVLLLSTLIFATLFANAAVALSVLLVRRIRTPANMLVLSLAITDFGIASVVMPLAAVQLWLDWRLPDYVCDIFIFCDMLFCSASIVNLALICADRYLVITKPFSYGLRRSFRLVGSFALCSWLIAVAVSLPAIVIWPKTAKSSECSYPPDLSFQLYAISVSFFVPTSAILFTTVKLFLTVSRMLKADRRLHPPPSVVGAYLDRKCNNNMLSVDASKTRVKWLGSVRDISTRHRRQSRYREAKAVKTLGVFVGTYLVCWLPFFTMQLVEATSRFGQPPFTIHSTIFQCFLWLGYVKSLCNPIISGLYNQEIRRPFLEILQCNCRTVNSSLRANSFASGKA